MAERTPMVMVSGQVKRLPAGDTIPVTTLDVGSATEGQVLSVDASGNVVWGAVSVGDTVPFHKADGTYAPINLDSSYELPFYEASGSANNIPLVT